MNINNIFNVAKVISNPIFKIKNGKPTTFFEAIIKSVDGSYCRINVISYYKLAKRCSYINKGDYVYLTGYYRNYIKPNGQYSHKNFIELASIDRILKDTSKLIENIPNITGNINQVIMCGVIVSNIRHKSVDKENKAFFKIVINELYNNRLEEIKVFVNVVLNGNVANNAFSWLNKGDHVYLLGSLQNFTRGEDITNNTYVSANYFKRIYSKNIYKIHREKKVLLNNSDLGEIVN